MDDITRRALTWLAGRDTGASSKCLCFTMLGIKTEHDYPHDAADLGRCLRLLQIVPEWHARLNEMAAVSPTWAALVARWDDLQASMRGDHDGERTYDLMQSIFKSARAS